MHATIQKPINEILARLCDDGNIERYDSEIVTRLGESLINAVSAEGK